MKKILITGANSYIGTSLEKWLMKNPNEYYIDTLDMRYDSWKEKDFSGYDVVFHVAGIVHIKETKENQELYFKVNRDLVFDTAKKAKADGVKQFIFISSMSVYGIENGIIDQNTPLKPNSAYGKSKKEAEELITKLADEFFIITIIRPPMVYGKGCKGNYTRLSSLALKTPLFPNIDNKRSMIYIDNLSEFVKQLIDNCSDGLFFPQNADYVNTSEMVRLIAEAHGKRLMMTKLLNPLLILLKVSTINKMFGDLVFEKNLSKYKTEYNVCGFKESILFTESRH